MEMPPKVDGCSWVLKFSTEEDGFTLNSLVRKLSDAVENAVDNLLTDRVMTAGVVVRRVLLKNVEWKRNNNPKLPCR